MKTVEDYIKIGMDRRTAEYFFKGRRSIIQVSDLGEYKLLLTFDNNEKRIFDVNPLLETGTVFESLINKETFGRVYLDENSCVSWDIDADIDGSKHWNNKVDISADSCYLDSIPVCV